MKDNKDIIAHLKSVAAQCKTRGEMGKRFPREYKRASSHKLLDKIFAEHPKQGFESRTNEELQALADQCKTRSEFARRFSGPYKKAQRNGLLDQLFGKHLNEGFDRKSLEEMKLAASQCKTRTEMARRFPIEYSAAHRRGLLDDIFMNTFNNGREENRRQNGYWTKETIITAAKSCTSRTQFSREFVGAYVTAKRLGIWVEIQTYLPPRKGGSNSRYIYAIALDSTKEVYVGLSYNPKKRFIDHQLKGKSSIKDLVCRGGTMRVVSGPHPPIIAVKKEYDVAKEYQNLGWNLLNSKSFGHLGGKIEKLSFELCQKLADQCKTRDEFAIKYQSARAKASAQKWMSSLFKNHENEGYVTTRWTEDKLSILAERCKTRYEMKVRFSAAYTSAQKRGLLNFIFKDHLNRGYRHKK